MYIHISCHLLVFLGVLQTPPVAFAGVSHKKFDSVGDFQNVFEAIDAGVVPHDRLYQQLVPEEGDPQGRTAATALMSYDELFE